MAGGAIAAICSQGVGLQRLPRQRQQMRTRHHHADDALDGGRRGAAADRDRGACASTPERRKVLGTDISMEMVLGAHYLWVGSRAAK